MQLWIGAPLDVSVLSVGLSPSQPRLNDAKGLSNRTKSCEAKHHRSENNIKKWINMSLQRTSINLYKPGKTHTIKFDNQIINLKE